MRKPQLSLMSNPSAIGETAVRKLQLSIMSKPDASSETLKAANTCALLLDGRVGFQCDINLTEKQTAEVIALVKELARHAAEDAVTHLLEGIIGKAVAAVKSLADFEYVLKIVADNLAQKLGGPSLKGTCLEGHVEDWSVAAPGGYDNLGKAHGRFFVGSGCR
jgi:hypothetical protein